MVVVFFKNSKCRMIYFKTVTKTIVNFIRKPTCLRLRQKQNVRS